MKKILTILLVFILHFANGQEVKPDTLKQEPNSESDVVKSKFARLYPLSDGIFYRFTDNAAITGLENKHNLNIGYYSNWLGLNFIRDNSIIRTSPRGYFATYEICLGEKKKNHLGINFKRNAAGNSKGWNAGFSYAFSAKIKRRTKVRVGLAINYFQKSLVNKNLTSNDQIDPRYGFIFASQEQLPRSSVGYLDFNLGTWVQVRQFQLGASIISPTQPDMGFFGLSSKPYIIFLHGQYDYRISRRIILSPYLQAKFSLLNTYTPGISASLWKKWIVGVSYYNLNTVHGLLGYSFGKNFRLNLSGGVPTEKELRAISTAAFVEGGLRYTFDFKKNKE